VHSVAGQSTGPAGRRAASAPAGAGPGQEARRPDVRPGESRSPGRSRRPASRQAAGEGSSGEGPFMSGYNIGRYAVYSAVRYYYK